MTEKKASKPAAQAEVEGDPTVTVKWRGLEFTIASAMEDWPVELTVAFEDGKAATAVRAALGPAQWAEFMRTKPRNRDLGELSDEIASALGLVEAGN